MFIGVAYDCRDGSLKVRLFEHAETLWHEDLANDDATAVQRANHLAATRRRHEAITLLKDCIEARSSAIQLRKKLAGYLEQEGQFSDALAEWDTIQYLNGTNVESRSSIERLRSKLR